jgi:LacI family transcriptional regulator
MSERSKPTTLKDIASRTGFTINTVSRALRDKEGISAPTRDLIQRTARDLGYIRDAVAGALRSRQTKIIAVVVPDISNPHFAIMVKEIEQIARTAGYATLIINTDEDQGHEEQAIRTALERKVDGVLLCSAQRSEASVLLLRAAGTPFVLFGRRFPGLETDYVVCDDKKGGYLATEYLLRRGAKRPLFLNGPAHISSAAERLEGYRMALADAGLPSPHELVQEISVQSGGCRRTLGRLAREGLAFDGVVAFNDMLAWEAYSVLSRVLPYRDLPIIGFDNVQSKLPVPLSLPSVSTAKIRMSKRACGLLLERLRGESREPTGVVLVTRVVEGRRAPRALTERQA